MVPESVAITRADNGFLLEFFNSDGDLLGRRVFPSIATALGHLAGVYGMKPEEESNVVPFPSGGTR